MAELKLELILELESFNDWIKNMPRKLPVKRHENEQFLFIDANGYFLEKGNDFYLAQMLNGYPVSVFRKLTLSRDFNEEQ